MNRSIIGDTLFICDDDGTDVLTMSERLTKERAYMMLSGNINSECARDFEDELICLLTVKDRIMLDMGGVAYISGAGFNALLSAQKLIDGKSGASLEIVNVSGKLMRDFDDIGFSNLLDVREKGKS